jgi:hypothetical protein
MGKGIDKGSAPEDSDLFSGGLTWSFHRVSKQSTSDGNSDSSNPQTQAEEPLRDDDPNQQEIVTEEEEPLSEEETEIYLKIQDKIDQYLIEVGAVDPKLWRA